MLSAVTGQSLNVQFRNSTSEQLGVQRAYKMLSSESIACPK